MVSAAPNAPERLGNSKLSPVSARQDRRLRSVLVAEYHRPLAGVADRFKMISAR